MTYDLRFTEHNRQQDCVAVLACWLRYY